MTPEAFLKKWEHRFAEEVSLLEKRLWGKYAMCTDPGDLVTPAEKVPKPDSEGRYMIYWEGAFIR